jgi:hypothetical protein
MNEVALFKKLIDEHGLKSKSRRRDIVYKRYFLYARMRRTMSLEYIASFFNKDHSSVIYGINCCRYYEKVKDQYFDIVTSDLRDDYYRLFDGLQSFAVRVKDYHNGVAIINIQVPMEDNLVKELENVENFTDFTRILSENRCATVNCETAHQV